MTPEAQRIKIAESLGWKPHGPYGDEDDELPDFLNDLNAAHEMELSLPESKRAGYCLMLDRVTGCEIVYFVWVCATAAQRAEAYLRTLGLWEESKP